jgi:16S rRNA processing protein RimM
VLLVAGRIGRAHGIRGEVAVDVRTDDPQRRFAPGATLATEPDRGRLTVGDARWHSGRLLVTFDGIADRTAAEQLRGTLLMVDVDDAARLEDPDEFYDHQLIGLSVVAGGDVVGAVSDVLHLPAQDVLVIRRSDDVEVLVPFVGELVPAVDLEAGTVTVDPRPGLLDPESTDQPGGAS